MDREFERRKAWRCGTIIGTAIVLTDDDRASDGLSIENLSTSGAMLVGDVRVVRRQSVTVVLQIDGHTISVAAEVVRADAHRVAVSFRDLAEREDHTIRHLVTSALEKQRARSAPAVLIIDDMIDVSATLERGLRALGRTSVCATTPLDAVRCLHDPAVRFEAAFVDMHFGQTDGRDVVGYLADEHPRVRRVLMSGEPPDRQDPRVDAFLAKPWRREHLAEALFGPDKA